MQRRVHFKSRPAEPQKPCASQTQERGREKPGSREKSRVYFRVFLFKQITFIEVALVNEVVHVSGVQSYET